jgi:hypothetical protein
LRPVANALENDGGGYRTIGIGADAQDRERTR